MKIIFLIAFVALITLTIGKEYNDCSYFVEMENVKAENMSGVWFTPYMISYGWEHSKVKCVIGMFEFNSTGYFAVTVALIDENSERRIDNYVATTVDGSITKLKMSKFSNAENTVPSMRYTHLLGTDYNNWAVWGTCMNDDDEMKYVVNMDSRRPTLDSQYLEPIKRVLEVNNVEGPWTYYDLINC